MRLILVFLLLFPFPVPARGATVTRVVDADTLVLDDGLKVRLYGVDCPERGQLGEQEATEYAAQRVLGQHVDIEEQYQDRYSRTVAIITLDNGSTLQEMLLREGLAWVAPRYCNRPECVEWKVMENTARRECRGLWNNEQPIPPWEWRRRAREGE